MKTRITLQDLLDETCTVLAYFDPAKKYVSNPGMGINAYAYSDHMHTGYTTKEWRKSEANPPLPLKRKTLEQIFRLPYTDNVYIRLEWKDIQKKKGKITLPPVWNWLLENVNKYHKYWSFRIMPSSPHSNSLHSLPTFLNAKIKFVPYYHPIGGKPRLRYYPLYNEEYLKWWTELLFLLAEKFDNHPLLEYVDISGYGLWGEWHHWTSNKPDEILKNQVKLNSKEVVDITYRLVDAHLKAFTKTPAVMLMAKERATFYALKQGAWLRRDSLQMHYSTAEYKLTHLLKPEAAYLHETIKPGVTIPETAHHPSRSFLDEPQRFLDLGLNYVSVGFNPWDTIYAHIHYREIYEQLASKLGYRIRPAFVWRKIKKHKCETIVLGLLNDGVANPPGKLIITAKFKNRKFGLVQLEAGKPNPNNKMTLVELALPKFLQLISSDVPISLSISIKLKNKIFPVQWAINSPTSKNLYEIDIKLYKIQK